MKLRTMACIAALTAAWPAAAAPLKIGVTWSNVNLLFVTKVRDAAQAQAKSMGEVTLNEEDAQGDLNKQIDQINNFIANGVDAIIVNTADTSGTDQITKLVSAAKIPLVYVNIGPEPGTKLPPKVSVVASDDALAGRLQMEGLAKCMQEKGDLAIIMGALAYNVTTLRTGGNKEIAAKYPNIKIVEQQVGEYQRNAATDLVTNWLTKGETFAGIAANNDEMAIGAIFALQQAGRSPGEVCIGGVDATEDALDQMQKGNLAVTVFQDAKGQGKASVETAVKLAKGGEAEPFVQIPFELVTRSNFKDYLKR